MKMMKTTCLPKTKVPPELADGLRNGEFPDVKELKVNDNENEEIQISVVNIYRIRLIETNSSVIRCA